MPHHDDAGTLPAKPAAPLYGQELAAGARAGEYVIQVLLAAGGCGAVYLAEHRVLARRAAVKVLHRELAESPEMIERFVREARAVNLIKHANIVDIYEFGQLRDGRPYFVMELLPGTGLDTFVARNGSVSPEQALPILEPLCAALDAAHQAGVVHRDLKASNVMVHEVDGRLQVKLVDFGIAKLIHPELGRAGLTSAARPLGTPQAMAPEQFRGGAITPRTDVYALGVLIYQLLTARLPFVADDPAEVERLHLDAPPPPPSQLAPLWPAIDAVVLRCLEKDPERRYESAPAVLAALRVAIESSRPRKEGSRRAVAIYLEIRIERDGEDFDERTIDEVAAILERARATLRKSGMELCLETGNAVLAVRLLEDDDVGERQRAVAIASELADELAARERMPPIRIAIGVHADTAELRGARGIGGPIAQIAAWTRPDAEGVYVTPAATHDFPSGSLIAGTGKARRQSTDRE